MKLGKAHIAKIDGLLRIALKEAEGNEVIRAVMVLGPLGREPRHEEAPPELLQLSSRTAYRQALIEDRQVKIGHAIGETRRQLADLKLSPRGGKVGHTIVVEGPAAQILASLELPGVRHASLDRRIGLVAPRGREQPPRKGHETDAS